MAVKKEDFSERLLKHLETEFRDVKKELESYQFVVDMTRIDATTRATINSKPYVKGSIYSDKTTGKKRNEFIVLQNNQQLRAVEKIIREAGNKTSGKDNTAFTSAMFQGDASQARKEEFVLERSSAARSKFAARIADKTKDTMKFASPTFHTEFSDKVGKRVSSYRIKFSTSSERNEQLETRLLNETVKRVRQELASTKVAAIPTIIAERRLDMIGDAFETGKVSSPAHKTRTKQTSKRTVATKRKTYFSRLSDAGGTFISKAGLHATLNAMLHDTIQTDFMRTKNAPRNKEYLRYQSGRFAKSAYVEQVKHTEANLDISYSYMEQPYSDFIGAPHGPGRNPRNIIEGAIRTILINQLHAKFNAIIRNV